LEERRRYFPGLGTRILDTLALMARLIFCLVVLAGLLPAQDVNKMRFVRASGEATISAKPDRAEVTIGVASRAPSAQAASSQNAEESSRVLTAIKQILGKGGDVKTSGYSLSPQYDYSDRHAPHLTGYEANNTVSVTVDDLSLLGKVIDSATATGATNVNGVSFTLRDPSPVRAQALAEAATRARANAEALAKALGVTVLNVLEAQPGETPIVRPLSKTFGPAAMAVQAATPIEAGDVDVHATVTVTMQIQ
jgi:uncharacterized protein YggE